MIKTTYSAAKADIDELFMANGFRLAPMAYAERDAYDGTLTLSDAEESESELDTVLWIAEDGYTACVTGESGEVLAEEPWDDLGDALEAYGRLTLEHGTSATVITM